MTSPDTILNGVLHRTFRPAAFQRYIEFVAERDATAEEAAIATWWPAPSQGIHTDGHQRLIMASDDAGLFAKAWIIRHNYPPGWPRDPEMPRRRYIRWAIRHHRWNTLKWLMDGYFEAPV